MLFYACLIDHFLVSFFVVLLDTPRLRMVHPVFKCRDTSDDTGFV